MLRPEPVRNKLLHRLSQELFTAVAEELFDLGIDEKERATLVHDQHAVGCRLHDLVLTIG